MAVVSRGYYNNSSADDIERDWQLFSHNIGLILNNQQKILNTADYFFCQPTFASCSWPYLKHDGSLPLGYLLLGLKYGSLIEKCTNCPEGKVLITSFAGSPLTDANSFTGLCICCLQVQLGKQSTRFKERMGFILKLRQAFPATVEKTEEYNSYEFSWGGNGLKPVTKNRIMQVAVARAVDLATLISEIGTGTIRQGKPMNISLLRQDYQLKFT